MCVWDFRTYCFVNRYSKLYSAHCRARLVLEICRISLIETESNPSRVKNPRETSIFLWQSFKFCYGDWGSKWNSIAQVSDHCLFIYVHVLYLSQF